MLNIAPGRRDLFITPAGQVVPASGGEVAPVTLTLTLRLRVSGRPHAGVLP
jgi:hypothetical protein